MGLRKLIEKKKENVNTHAAVCLTLLDALYRYLEDRGHENRQTGEKEDKDTSDSLFPEEETITKIQI